VNAAFKQDSAQARHCSGVFRDMGPDRKGAILMIRTSIFVAALFAAGSAFAQTAATAPGAKATPAVASPSHVKPAAATATAPADVNTATLEQLSTVKGLNKPLAEAIIKGRPYKSLDELTKNKIMSDEAFARVKDELTIRHQ
jgi:competence protein ComEA